METIEIDIPFDEFSLKGNLIVPKEAICLVIFHMGVAVVALAKEIILSPRL